MDSAYFFRRQLGKITSSALRCLPAETAYNISLNALKYGLQNTLPKPPLDFEKSLACFVPSIGKLAHPIGLGAGFDRNGECRESLLDIGFSFVEVGTVTPKSQPGKPKPRIFTNPESRTMIHRTGINNFGHDVLFHNITKSPWTRDAPLGINIGKNTSTPWDKSYNDYLFGIRKFLGQSNYLTLNMSAGDFIETPNRSVDGIIHDIASLLTKDEKTEAKIWFKLDPDMEKKSFQKAIEAIVDQQFSGVILTNTQTTKLPEPGQLSGHSLAISSTKSLEFAWEVHRGQLPMIASGGILTGSDILQKIVRGACAVQIYTALIYRGVFAVYELLNELVYEMKNMQVESISDLVGTYYGDKDIWN